jgi:hypothetical protein
MLQLRENSEMMTVVLQTEDCVEAHTNVDVIVNLDEFRALLDNRLPLVFGGASLDEAALLWPPIE